MRVKPVPRSRDAPLSTVPRWITLADTESDLTVPGYSRLIDSPDVANAVGMVADIISDATIWLMENTDEGDKRLKNELSRMIDITPYSLGTRQTWVSWIVTTMFTSGDGNAFVLPVSRNGRIEELLPMPGATTLPQDNGLSYSCLLYTSIRVPSSYCASEFGCLVYLKPILLITKTDASWHRDSSNHLRF